MQNVIKYAESGGGNFDEDNLMFPCNEVDAKYIPQCYHYHTTYLLSQNKGSVMESFSDCDIIIPEEFVKYCYHGMGRELLNVSKGDLSMINKLCQMGEQAQYYKDCFRGMVMILVNWDRDPSIGFVFCENIPNHSKIDCFDALGKWIIMLHSEENKRIELCSNIENIENIVYFKTCTNASLEEIRLL